MQFGPYTLSLPPRLHFQDIVVDVEVSVTHILGDNGTGKTTLMQCMVDECIAKNIPFAYINQNYRANWLWWLTVEENLYFSLYKHLPFLKKALVLDHPQVQKQLHWLEPLLQQNTKQVDFSHGGELSTLSLSGGQLQRVILFREMLHNPQIVFLDEAFSALDKKVAGEILEWLLAQQQELGFKIVSISHDFDLVKKAPGISYTLSRNQQGVVTIEKGTI